MTQLYVLSQAVQTLQSLLEDGNDTDIQAALEGAEMHLEEKIEQMALMVRNFESDAVALKLEIDRLTKRHQSLTNGIKSTKKYIQNEMLLAGLDKVKTTKITIGIQYNPHKLIGNEDMEFPPYEYIDVKSVTTLDKKRMIEDMKNGKVIEGFELIQEEGLRIR